MSDLFGGLPGFAGGPPAPTHLEPRPRRRRRPIPVPEPEDDYEVTGDIRDHTWDVLPVAKPGQATTLWGAPERAEALWGPITATEPVLGDDPTTLTATDPQRISSPSIRPTSPPKTSPIHD